MALSAAVGGVCTFTLRNVVKGCGGAMCYATGHTLGFRRPFLSRIQPSLPKPETADGRLGVSLAECDRFKGSQARPIRQLEGSAGGTVELSTLVDRAAEL